MNASNPLHTPAGRAQADQILAENEVILTTWAQVLRHTTAANGPDQGLADTWAAVMEVHHDPGERDGLLMTALVMLARREELT